MIDFKIINSQNLEIAVRLQQLLRAAKKLNPDFFTKSEGCEVTTSLNYPLQWGLGSSSTLIAAVADWAIVDPFKLHYAVSNGSGYDIACAINNGPVLYSCKNQNPNVQRVQFKPRYANKIFFVYQGKKQDSVKGINFYRKSKVNFRKNELDSFSRLTDRMLAAETIFDFEEVIREHEQFISEILRLKPIKETVFFDLPGEVKSLGAWGGDFCMLTWNDNTDKLIPYLKSKGLDVCYNFSEIVL